MMAMTRRILERMLDHGLISSLDDWTIVAASGGLNSQVCFARQHGSTPTFTVRSSAPGDEWKLRRETAFLDELSGRCGCIPQGVTGIDGAKTHDPPLLVHRYATGATAPLKSVSETQLAALAGCLAGLHQIEQGYYAIWPDTETGTGTLAHAYRDRLVAIKRYKSYASTGRIGGIYQQLAEFNLDGAAWQGRIFSQLHGDLSAGNIIWDARSVTLIDWEYARYGDPAEDLAYLFAEQPVSAERYAVFKDMYVSAGGDQSAFVRVPVYSALVALDSALWWADYTMQVGQAQPDMPEIHNRLASAEEALNRLK